MARRHRRRAILLTGAVPHDKGDDVAVLPRAILLAAQAFVVVGCAAAGPSSPPSSPSTMTNASPGEATASASAPVDATPPGESPAPGSPRSPIPSPSPGESTPRPSLTAAPIRSGAALRITGTLSFDAIEGGCPFLETAEGKRYEVLYPEGWSIDRGSGRLVGPDGRSVEPGGTITVRGSIASDIASICQVGPIVRAVEVVTAGQ
jgi:hypothetical protein